MHNHNRLTIWALDVQCVPHTLTLKFSNFLEKLYLCDPKYFYRKQRGANTLLKIRQDLKQYAPLPRLVTDNTSLRQK